MPKGSPGGWGSARPAGVDPGHHVGRRPAGVVEARPVPPVRVAAGVEGLDGQAGHVAGHGDRGPRLTRRHPPAGVADHPVTGHLGLEDQTAGAERVGGRDRRPPRGRLAEVVDGHGQDVPARVQERRQVHDVVVGTPGIGPHRAPCHLGAVDVQDVATVDPHTARHPVGHGGQVDGPPEEPDPGPAVTQLRSGDRRGHDVRPFEPDPAGPPGGAERGGVVEAHGGRVASRSGPGPAAVPPGGDAVRVVPSGPPSPRR